jgi:hypothetical protein
MDEECRLNVYASHKHTHCLSHLLLQNPNNQRVCFSYPPLQREYQLPTQDMLVAESIFVQALNNEVELDEGFFETVSVTRDKSEPLKRGKGSQKQTTVLVATESKPVEDSEKSKKFSKKK